MSIPLLIVITTAIATAKVPELFRANQGFWYMVSDARTDFAMFCCLVFSSHSVAGTDLLTQRLRSTLELMTIVGAVAARGITQGRTVKEVR